MDIQDYQDKIICSNWLKISSTCPKWAIIGATRLARDASIILLGRKAHKEICHGRQRLQEREEQVRQAKKAAAAEETGTTEEQAAHQETSLTPGAACR
jgi:heme exporter protein D